MTRDRPEPEKNRLARATSPYLRQHGDNPVDWYEWSEEALARARAEDRPILLSVGYSACHWCHVMAHESFEDPETAAVMNAHFINIKVDREERPDIDAIYQKVLQLMGEGGGWPLTVFLTPAQEPFYGGTYFPSEPSYGRPAFRHVLTALHNLYANKRDEVQEQVRAFMQGFAMMRESLDEGAASQDLSPAQPEGLRAGVARLLQHVDGDWGGFGRAPKFPSASALELFLIMSRRPGGATASEDQAATRAACALRLTLEKMWRGGVYDHLRGGFARYSVDRYWRVPHFEKMLYDNAQLLALYAEASARWPEDEWLWSVVVDTIEYLRVDMRDPGGAFYAATDADSEGEEGKFFAWTPEQIAEALQDDELTRVAVHTYGVTRAGSFERGRSVLQREHALELCAQQLDVTPAQLRGDLERARARLLEHRYTRVPPGRDEKLLTAWNGLLIGGLARVAGVCERRGDEPTRRRALELAQTAAAFLLAEHVQADGRVLRASFEGRAHTRGYIEDVSTLARACLELYEQTLAPRWRAAARALAEHALARYAREGGGWFLTADDAEALIERSEAHRDAATPSGAGVMIELLLRLDAHGVAPEGARAPTGATLRRFAGAPTSPSAQASVLSGARWAWPAAAHVTLRGRAPADVAGLARVVRGLRLETRAPIGLGFTAHEGPAEAIVCRGPVCSAPLATADALRAALLSDPRAPGSR